MLYATFNNFGFPDQKNIRKNHRSRTNTAKVLKSNVHHPVALRFEVIRNGHAFVTSWNIENYYLSISMKRIVCMSLSLSFFLNAFAQFSRYRAETLQVGRGRSGIGRGWVRNVGGVHRGIHIIILKL